MLRASASYSSQWYSSVHQSANTKRSQVLDAQGPGPVRVRRPAATQPGGASSPWSGCRRPPRTSRPRPASPPRTGSLHAVHQPPGSYPDICTNPLTLSGPQGTLCCHASSPRGAGGNCLHVMSHEETPGLHARAPRGRIEKGSSIITPISSMPAAPHTSRQVCPCRKGACMKPHSPAAKPITGQKLGVRGGQSVTKQQEGDDGGRGDRGPPRCRPQSQRQEEQPDDQEARGVPARHGAA